MHKLERKKQELIEIALSVISSNFKTRRERNLWNDKKLLKKIQLFLLKQK